MAPYLQTRADPLPTDKGETMGPIYIVGCVLACLAAVGVFIWWASKQYKIRKAEALEKKNHRKSMDVKEKASGSQPADMFTHEKLTPAVILPKRGDAGPVVRLPPARPRSVINSNSTNSLNSPSTSSLGSSNNGRPQSLRPPTSARPNSSTPSLRRPTGLRNSFVPNRMSTASMSEKEIVDYHVSSGTLPVAFAPLTLGDFGTFGLGAMAKAQGATTPGAKAEADSDGDSFLNMADEKKKHGSVSSLSFGRPGGDGAHKHSRFPSLSASFRQSVQSISNGLSPTRSLFQFGAKHSHKAGSGSTSDLPSAGTDQHTVKVTFNPLLPDELVLQVNEKVTILETYDDGWCICARTHLGMLEVGAIPEFCFSSDVALDRSMRSSSLGVTVDLRVVEEIESGGRGRGLVKAANVRDSVMSWSNF